MSTIPTMTMKKNTDHAIVMPAPPTPHHHHHHHRVSSSSSSAVGVGVGSVGVVGVGVLPTIRGWTHDGLEGTVSGFMSGSRIFPDGSPVTTSRLIVDPGVALSAGCIVQTKSGSRYVLGDEARKGGGGHHRHHPRGAPPSSSTAATPWSMSSPMRRRLWRLSRPIASHLRSIGGRSPRVSRRSIPYRDGRSVSRPHPCTSSSRLRFSGRPIIRRAATATAAAAATTAAATTVLR